MTATEPLALYVHWPFCVSKCPYCDFNSHVRTGINHDEWREALISDLAHEAEAVGQARLGSIFFGGGTPSLMPPALVEAVIAAAQRHWAFADGIEITLEANPSSVEAARFADLARAGVNRVSLGMQALDDAALALLGRAHSVNEARAALETAQAHFARVNADFIYALPGQSEADWRHDLARIIGFGTGHLSLYQLTIEPGTRFATLVRDGRLVPVEPDRAADLYEMTQAMTRAAALPAYETSNHARAGEASRHNLAYWRYGTYAGIGPGAHGRRGGVATERHRKPENFLNAVARNGHGIAVEEQLAPAERAREALVMGLRLAEGVDLAHLAAVTGIDPPLLTDPVATERLIGHGLIARDDDRLRVLPAGALLLDRILVELVAI